jgi:hypothetical protein
MDEIHDINQAIYFMAKVFLIPQEKQDIIRNIKTLDYIIEAIEQDNGLFKIDIRSDKYFSSTVIKEIEINPCHLH